MTLLIILVALALGLAAFEALAQAGRSGNGGPFDLALLGTYAWVLLVSLLGGFASFYQKVCAGHARWFNLGELAGELATSAIAGLITYWLARSGGVNEWMTAALIGIAGHMGSRAMFMLEKLLERWANRMVGASPAPMATREPARGTPGDRIE